MASRDRRPWATRPTRVFVPIHPHFLALQGVEVAYMIAVKRTSLLFGILYGALVFGERQLGTRLLAGGIMLGGVLLIALGNVAP